jgi:predicted transcriptional regulator YdeE
MHSLIPYSASRRYYGISWPDRNGNIQYYAGAETLKSEDASIKETEPFTIHKGTFASLTIQDYMKDLQGIGNAFKTFTSVGGPGSEGLLAWNGM